MDDDEIMKCSKARGVDFGESSIVQKVKAMIPILIPTLCDELKACEFVAIAMEARGYPGRKRVEVSIDS